MVSFTRYQQVHLPASHPQVWEEQSTKFVCQYLFWVGSTIDKELWLLTRSKIAACLTCHKFADQFLSC